MVLERLQLKVVKQLDNAVFEVRNEEGMLFYWVDHPQAKALIAQQGAHLVSYRPNPGKEKLWLSDSSEFTRGKAIRGGIPICWPCFGTLGGDTYPRHGFARTSQWSLDTIKTTEQYCQLILTLCHDSTPEIALSCKFTLGEQASIELTTTNNSPTEFEITGALHSYFITDVKKLHIGSLGDQYIDSVSQQTKYDVTQFELSEETDRIYLKPKNISHLSWDNSTVEIEHRGHDSVVVWNPGKKLADNMADLHSADHFICIETAITQSPVKIPAKHSHQLIQVIR
ncbi:D-hexose-6-phosphate mutarotase [Agarivorans sp. TSD2052]|uniref:D-hexose-6-phosphate mutarotase n=1 Tax=Agarivorans sp. TSD2052 TaxID=2937286 RepID=UPI002010284A|nr:D-hexose-6-phosphate mutarotase [Agarivorans sp. TSD2052]UPW20427.1 D-hexose-6-phosphate mutarotase [Agarivorans sp. TSD2052]